MTRVSEIERDSPLVPPFAALDHAVGDESIDQSHRSRVRQAQDASKLVVGWSQAVSDDDDGSGGFTRVPEYVARGHLDALSNSQPHDAQQIGSTIYHQHKICAARTIFNLTLCALRTQMDGARIGHAILAMESTMNDTSATRLTPEHLDFYERFKSFWAAPSGPRVAELIARDATIHFTGAGTFSGADYIDVMAGMLGAMVEFKVTPRDCAGDGDRLYIFWEASALIDNATRTWVGVDRMRIADGMAIEEHVIFDSAVLQPAN